jgi:hypothetical protein
VPAEHRTDSLSAFFRNRDGSYAGDYTNRYRELCAALRHKLIFDGRNLYDPERLAELGWTYDAIGRGASVQPVV